ncbi:MAG TPA: hypothetical protein VJ799_13410, partial [Nitrososphaeraceae archaeon]|nr:hypothetical protein [Nitrososphaeraceae archaeon]
MSTNGNNSNNKIVVKIVPFGPNIRNINSLTSKLLSRPRVRGHLKSISDEELEKKKNKRTNIQSPRLLSFELLPETIDSVTISKRTTSLPRNYLAKYYDYENNCCLTIKGKLGQQNPTELVESKQQPLPNTEEFEEALGILRQKEPSIAEAIQNNILKLYRPMPPIYIQETSDGDIERTLCIGLRPTGITGD